MGPFSGTPNGDQYYLTAKTNEALQNPVIQNIYESSGETIILAVSPETLSIPKFLIPRQPSPSLPEIQILERGKPSNPLNPEKVS